VVFEHSVIYKYPIPFVIGRAIPVTMPRGAKILSVQVQGETLCLWAMVDPSLPTETETIRIIATGEPIDPTLAVMIDHLATIQSGPYVWHVFKGG
jgi:hypothetical protein